MEVPNLTVSQHKCLDAPRVGLSFHVLAKRYPSLIGDNRFIDRYLLGQCEDHFECGADVIQEGLDFPPLCGAVCLPRAELKSERSGLERRMEQKVG